MTDRSVTPAGALAAAEMTRLQSEGGTATQRMAAARMDDEESPLESVEGLNGTQHATNTTPAAAAADGSCSSASMPTPARVTPWLTAQGEVHARDSQERRAEQRLRSIKRLELEAQLKELEHQEQNEQRVPELQDDSEPEDDALAVWEQLREARAAREAAERARAEQAPSWQGWQQQPTPWLPTHPPPSLGAGAPQHAGGHVHEVPHQGEGREVAQVHHQLLERSP